VSDREIEASPGQSLRAPFDTQGEHGLMGVAVRAPDARSKPRWEGPVVPFVLSPNLTSADRGRIADALVQYEQASGLRFVARDSQGDFLELRIGQSSAPRGPVARVADRSSRSTPGSPGPRSCMRSVMPWG
jgi:hypothetical protein